jgi:hypothetical protein
MFKHISIEDCEYVWGVTPIQQLKTPPLPEDQVEQIKTMLHAHGCTVDEKEDHCIFNFPDGTKRFRGWVLGVSERYKIEFPDGFVLLESYDIPRGISLLSAPIRSSVDVRP